MNILIVDDNKLSRKVIFKMVAADQHQVFMADGSIQALALLAAQSIDLILMDIEMPGMDGFQLTRLIRKQQQHWIPIIFLSGNDSDAYLAQGIDAGGDDYLTKPVKEIILNAKIRAMARIALMQQQLDEANKKLEELSHIDSLTEVVNRRALDELLAKEWRIYQRTQSELSLLMLDIDYFKQYNDNYGHQRGDKCLRLFAQLLMKQVNRASDIVARYGGEEFVMLLPNTPLSGARFKAKEIIKLLNTGLIGHEYSQVAPYVTASIGVACTSAHIESEADLIKFADQALYQAKHKGRNCCVVYQA